VTVLRTDRPVSVGRLARPLASSWLALVASAAVTFASGAAHADTACMKDADCVKGFICQTSEFTACPDIACAPNEPCPVCTPTTSSECVPGPCSTDSDCATGMVCFSQVETSECATPAAPPCATGVECPPDPAVDAGSCTSTTTTVKSCVPRYDLPCTASADCGANFTCVADQECGCSGSAGPPLQGSSTPSSGPSTPDDPAPAMDSGTTAPSCSCTNLPTSHCVANVIDCTAASDCPAQWSCSEPPSAATGCAVSRSADGSTTSNCVQVPVQNVCQPPYSDLDVGQSFNGGATSGLAEGTPTAASDTGAGAGASSGSKASTQGGCQVGSGPVDLSSGAWLGLLGIAAFARRRKAERA
jgi:MYXO-CTERM domain-containing protein